MDEFELQSESIQRSERTLESKPQRHDAKSKTNLEASFILPKHSLKCSKSASEKFDEFFSQKLAKNHPTNPGLFQTGSDYETRKNMEYSDRMSIQSLYPLGRTGIEPMEGDLFRTDPDSNNKSRQTYKFTFGKIKTWNKEYNEREQSTPVSVSLTTAGDSSSVQLFSSYPNPSILSLPQPRNNPIYFGSNLKQKNTTVEYNFQACPGSLLLPFYEKSKDRVIKVIPHEMAILLVLASQFSKLDKTVFCFNCQKSSFFKNECNQIKIIEELKMTEFMSRVRRTNLAEYDPKAEDLPEIQLTSAASRSVSFLLNRNCSHRNYRRAFEKCNDIITKLNKSSEYLNVFQFKKCKRGRSENFDRKLIFDIGSQLSMNNNYDFIKYTAEQPGRGPKPHTKWGTSVERPRRGTGRRGGFSQSLLHWFVAKQSDRLQMQMRMKQYKNSEMFKMFFTNSFVHKKKSSNVIFIDCRFEYEFNGGHVPGAINISDSRVFQKLFFNDYSKNKKSLLRFIKKYKNTRIEEETADHILANYKRHLEKKSRKNSALVPNETSLHERLRADPKRRGLAANQLENFRKKTRRNTKDNVRVFQNQRTKVKNGLSSKITTKIRSSKRDTKKAKKFEKLLSHKKIKRKTKKKVQKKCSGDKSRLYHHRFSSDIILIFYCEFSSKRGPKMYSLCREFDREMNKFRYPELTYPNIYLMNGGYQCFHENFKYFCTRPAKASLDQPRKTSFEKKFESIYFDEPANWQKSKGTSRCNEPLSASIRFPKQRQAESTPEKFAKARTSKTKIKERNLKMSGLKKGAGQAALDEKTCFESEKCLLTNSLMKSQKTKTKRKMLNKKHKKKKAVKKVKKANKEKKQDKKIRFKKEAKQSFVSFRRKLRNLKCKKNQSEFRKCEKKIRKNKNIVRQKKKQKFDKKNVSKKAKMAKSIIKFKESILQSTEKKKLQRDAEKKRFEKSINEEGILYFKTMQTSGKSENLDSLSGDLYQRMDDSMCSDDYIQAKRHSKNTWSNPNHPFQILNNSRSLSVI